MINPIALLQEGDIVWWSEVNKKEYGVVLTKDQEGHNESKIVTILPFNNEGRKHVSFYDFSFNILWFKLNEGEDINNNEQFP